MRFLLIVQALLLLADLQIIVCGAGGLPRNDGSNPGTDGFVVGKPSHVTVSCLNLNYTLHWDPPIGPSTGDTLYYTVEYYGLGLGWLRLPTCTNITQQSCYIFPVFNTHDDVFRDLKVRVQAHDPDGNVGPVVTVIFNPLTNATVGAPTVSIAPDMIGPYDAVVNLKAPMSPIDNMAVTGQLTEIAIKYNISVWKQSTKIMETLVASSMGVAYLSSLRPDTSYEFRVFTTYDTMYGINNSPDVNIVTFTTKQKSPSYGPDVVLGRISKPNCGQPNLRNITIDWKAPPVDSWNGQITNYTLTWREREAASTLKHTVTDLSKLSHTLVDLSRWKVYQVSVSANNNGGTAPSAWLTISADTLDKSGSQPVDLQVEEVEDLSILVSWQPPNQYPQCIVGYQVIYQWNDVDGIQRRQGSVHNTTEYQTKALQPAVYTFQVAPKIQSGYDNVTIGLAASINYPQTGNNGEIVFRWPPIIIVLVIVIVISLGLWVCLWKRKKLRRVLGLHNLFHLDDNNKIIKFAQNYTSSGVPVKHVEPELFDAIVPSRETCPDAENGICSNTNCSCSIPDEHISDDKLFTKLNIRRYVSIDSPELPVLTPDIGFSCFQFPDFSKKSHQEKERGNPLLENQPLVQRNHYLKVDTGEANQGQLSLSMDDLYLGVQRPDIDIESESSQLLPETDNSRLEKPNIETYCKMSQVPPMRNIKYSRLNSYSDTDVSSEVNVSNFDNKGTILPLGYDNGANMAHNSANNTSPVTIAKPRDKHDKGKSKVQRMDSYPYCKLAFGKSQNCPTSSANDNIVENFMLSDGSFTPSQDEVTNICDQTACDSKEKVNLNNMADEPQLQELANIADYVQHGMMSPLPVPTLTECKEEDQIEPYILISEL